MQAGTVAGEAAHRAGRPGNDFVEISEDEANQIVERIRATVTGASNG